jgi:peptidoglycan/LPS O-acetylase OafA/YrhL
MPDASRTAYLPNLTGVRGLAATWVLAQHAWNFANQPLLAVPAMHIDLTPLVKCGYVGVDLFFVLSGFLLSMPFHRAALERRAYPSLKIFWIHRCRRVLPAYWLQIVILATIFFVLGEHPDQVAPRNLAAIGLLVFNIVPWPVPLLNVVYWSMPVEWDFYVVLPLLAWLVTRCRWPLALLFAMMVAVAFRVLCYWSLTDARVAAFVSYWDIQQLPARLDQFFVGICVAWIAAGRMLSTRTANACLAAGAAGIITMLYVAAPRDDFLSRADAPYIFYHHTLTAAAFGLLVLGAAGRTRAGALLFANRPMTFLGLISYSLYLWHHPLLRVLQVVGLTSSARVPAWLVVLLALPVVLIVAWLSYRFVETPFLHGTAAPRPAKAEAA